MQLRRCKFSAEKNFSRHFGEGFKPVNPPPLKYGPDIKYAKPLDRHLNVNIVLARRSFPKKTNWFHSVQQPLIAANVFHKNRYSSTMCIRSRKAQIRALSLSFVRLSKIEKKNSIKRYLFQLFFFLAAFSILLGLYASSGLASTQPSRVLTALSLLLASVVLNVHWHLSVCRYFLTYMYIAM